MGILRDGLAVARAAVRFRTGRLGRPAFVTYTVTWACNARCRMCDAWRKERTAELTSRDVEAIFAQLEGAHAVRLTGGEPFLRPDLVEIAEAIRRAARPARILVTTNGLLPGRAVDFVRRVGDPRRLDLLVSIDGVGPYHDRVRGRRGAFDRAMETVRALAALRPRLGFSLAVNQTVGDRAGFAERERLLGRLAPHGVPVHLVLAYRESAMYSSGAARVLRPRWGCFDLAFDVPPEELGPFLARSIRETAAYRDRVAAAGKRYYLRGIEERLLRGRARPNPRCVALTNHLRILPSGRVPICQFNLRTVGDLRRTPFRTVWTGPRARRARAWVRSCPGCWAECEVLPSALYGGDVAGLFAYGLGRRAGWRERRSRVACDLVGLG